MKIYASLQNVLSFNFVLVATLPFIVFGYIVLQILSTSMEKEIAEKNLMLAKALTGEVERFLAEPLNLLELLEKTLDKNGLIHGDQINSYLNSVIKNYRFFNRIEVLDQKGIVRHIAPYNEDYLGIDMSGQPFFRVVSELRKPSWSTTFISMQTDQPTLTLANPLNTGMIVGYLNLAVLNSIIDRVKIGSQGYAAITDQEGIAIAHRNKSFVAQRLNLKSLNVVREGLSGKEGTYRYYFKGIEEIGSVSFVPQTGWLVIVAQPYKEAFVPIKRIKDIIWIGIWLAILFAIVIALASLKKTLKPLKKLTENAQRIAAGDYNLTPHPKSYREIDELTNDFQIMIEAVKTREEALRESEEKYRSMMESMKAAVYICSPDFRVEYMNPAMIKRTGRDATGEICHKAIHDLDEQCPWCVHAKIQQGESVETEILSPKDKRYYNVSHSPIFHQNDSISKMTIYRDRTESKQVEEERNRLATAIEHAAESVIIASRPGTIQYVNPSFERLSGYTQEEIVGQNFRILKSDKHDESFYKEMWDIIAKGNVWAGRITNRMKGGTLRDFETRISPVRDSSGEIINFVSVNRDVTQEVALEAQLRQAQKLQSIGTLAGGIAHDFNNILYPIIGYTEMAIDDVPADSLTRRNLLEVLKATKRARDLVQQILTFSRQSELELKPLKFQSIVKEALKLLRASIPSTITISQNINNACGAIRGDQTQIHQIAMNLCTNAYQSMEETGGKLELSLDEIAIGTDEAIDEVSLQPGRYSKLTVSDTGHGMEPAVMEKIFDPYFTTKEPGKGTGLGLSVVHGIVNTHNGHISASSEPGKGTKFNVYLPLFGSADIEAETISPETLATGDEHILLVDDEKQIVDVVRQMLERLGYQITVRTSSIEALEAFRASPAKFDLVITDLTMPNMTGDKLSGELMNIRSDIPVILCTGFSEKMSKERAEALGIKDFLMKPVIINALAQTVRKILDES